MKSQTSGTGSPLLWEAFLEGTPSKYAQHGWWVLHKSPISLGLTPMVVRGVIVPPPLDLKFLKAGILVLVTLPALWA